MIKSILLTFMLFFCLQNIASAQFTIGGGAAYVFPGSSFGFQAKGLVGVGEKIDFSPSVGVFFEEGTPFVVNADVQYDLLEVGEDFRILPFAGLNYFKNEVSDLGLNLGVSFRFDVSENTVYIEPKLTVFSYGGMALAGGILF